MHIGFVVKALVTARSYKKKSLTNLRKDEWSTPHTTLPIHELGKDGKFRCTYGGNQHLVNGHVAEIASLASRSDADVYVSDKISWHRPWHDATLVQGARVIVLR
jgi:hypothetical protein